MCEINGLEGGPPLSICNNYFKQKVSIMLQKLQDSTILIIEQ
jgi:hypothetical protein